MIPQAITAKIGALAIGASAAFLLGFAAGELHEHRAPWGLKAQKARLEASLPKLLADARQAGMDAQAEADRPAFERWSAELRLCRDELRTSRDDAGKERRRLEEFARAQASASYRLGRATCGGTDANRPDPGPGPSSGADPGRVSDADDLGRLVNEAAASGAR